MQWLKSLFGWLIHPLGSLPPERRRRVIRWTVHVLLVVAAVVVLALLNHYAGLDRILRTRFLGIYHVWLPLLFLLGYALYWLIRWLYWLLGPDGPGEFADIESAWRRARAELDEAGVGLTEAPVYLVLGRPAGALQDFFAAGRLPLQVRHAPGEGEAPLHVYASREAIFVTCEEASLLPVQADRLRETLAPPEPPAATPIGAYLEKGEVTSPENASPPQPAQPEAAPAAPAVLLLGEPQPSPEETPRPAREPLLKDVATVERATRRLRQVCKTLARDRQPYCPVNGILILVPLDATVSPEDAAETAAVARHDLETAREALQLDCPRFIVLCDAEKLPGFAEVARHFPEGGAGPRWVLGQHFPLAPDAAPAEVPRLIETGLAWVADTMLPLVIGQLWQREGEEGGPADRAAAVEANIRLYEFLAACRERVALLGKLAARAVQAEDRPPLLGGCYLAGTGPDAEREQRFLAGVLRRAIEQQNQVRWTADALADDRAYRRYAAVGYALLVGFVVALALILTAWW